MEQKPSNVREMLEREEGRVAHCYLDSQGYQTIGVGRLIDERKGGRLSDEEIDFLLDNDIKAKTAGLIDVLPWVDKLDDVRKAVLIGMAFQLGVDGLLEFTHTLAAIQFGKYGDAARMMLESLWAKQTPARAQRMAKQMDSGEWQ